VRSSAKWPSTCLATTATTRVSTDADVTRGRAPAESRNVGRQPIEVGGDGFALIVETFVEQLVDRRACNRDQVDRTGGLLGFDQRRGVSNGGQGEREPMPHVPDTVPGKRVTGAGARTEGREAAVKHPRWEPYAGKPHVRFYAGGAQ
jgi:hypothetical protein